MACRRMLILGCIQGCSLPIMTVSQQGKEIKGWKGRRRRSGVAGWKAWGLSSVMFSGPRRVIHTSLITGNRQDIQAFITSIYHHHFINLSSCEPALQPVPKHPSQRAAGQRFTPTHQHPLPLSLQHTHTHTKQEGWASMSTLDTHRASKTERERECVKAILQPDMVWSCSPKGLRLTGYPAFWKPLTLQPHHTTCCCCWPTCRGGGEHHDGYTKLREKSLNHTHFSLH